MKIFKSLFVSLFLLSLLTACGSAVTTESPVLTPPAISMDITGDRCPSVEVKAGMQIAWTNRDNVDRILWIDRKDESGNLMDAGGTDLLQPEVTFTITLTDPGVYTYYCSKDRQAFGTITVTP